MQRKEEMGDYRAFVLAFAVGAGKFWRGFENETRCLLWWWL